MGSPGVDEWAPGQSCSHFSSSQHSSPWPWQLLRSRRPQAPTLTLRPILGTATTATGHTGEATMVTDTATMATTERGLLMPLPSLDPTPMLRLTPGTDTTATATGHMAMDITGTGHTATHT